MCFWKDGTKTVERSEQEEDEQNCTRSTIYMRLRKETIEATDKYRSFKYRQHLSEDNDKNRIKKRRVSWSTFRQIHQSCRAQLPLRIDWVSVEEEQYLSLWEGLQEGEEKLSSLLQRIYSLIVSPQIIPL